MEFPGLTNTNEIGSGDNTPPAHLLRRRGSLSETVASEGRPLMPGQVSTTIPNRETVAVVKQIIAHLKNFDIKNPMVREDIDMHANDVEAKLKELANLDVTHPDLLKNVEKIGTISRTALGSTITVTAPDRSPILFEVTLHQKDDKEIYLVFDKEITKKESILRGGKSEFLRAIRFANGIGTKFLHLKTEALKSSHATEESRSEAAEKLLQIHRLSTIKTHLEGLPDEVKRHLILPHKVTVISSERGTNLVSYMQFQKGEHIGPLTGELPEKVGAQLITALAAIHAQGVTHNDIKDNNLILSPEGELYIIDWDTAIKEGDPKDSKSLLGMTSIYVPPEALDKDTYKEVTKIQRWSEAGYLLELAVDKEAKLVELPEGEEKEQAAKELANLKTAILPQFKEDIDSLKAEIKNLDFPDKEYFSNMLVPRTLEPQEYDYKLLCTFAIGYDLTDGFPVEGQLKEDLSKEFQPFEQLLFSPKLDLFKDELYKKIEINQAALQTHPQRVKSDSYQAGIVLRQLFGPKYPYPAPYDAIIPGLLKENPEERLNVQDALNILKSS